MLYALRHQSHPNNDLRGLVGSLKRRNVSEHHLQVRAYRILSIFVGRQWPVR